VPGSQHGVAFAAGDIRFGKGIKVADGRDITLIATGPQLKSALGARDLLARRGCDAEVLYIHTIRPLDDELILASVSKTGHAVVIEEHMRSGGLGDDVLRATRSLASVKFASASIPDAFVRAYGSYEDHCETLGLSPVGVAALVEREFGR
jgi:transketolase